MEGLLSANVKQVEGVYLSEGLLFNFLGIFPPVLITLDQNRTETVVEAENKLQFALCFKYCRLRMSQSLKNFF